MSPRPSLARGDPHRQNSSQYVTWRGKSHFTRELEERGHRVGRTRSVAVTEGIGVCSQGPGLIGVRDPCVQGKAATFTPGDGLKAQTSQLGGGNRSSSRRADVSIAPRSEQPLR